MTRPRRKAPGVAAAAAFAVLAATLLSVRGESAASAAEAGAPSAKTRPNVVVLMTDDQTLETLRVMTNTKRLLGGQGTTFANHFVTFALCCPSRATFLTGQYAHTHKVLGNNPPEGGYEKLDHSNTLPVWLQRAGYHTVHLGKYLNGYGTRRNETEIPPGWSEWYGATKLTFLGHRLNENGKIVEYGDDPASYQTDVYSRKAVDLIRRLGPSSKPFFLNVWFYAPHGGGPREADDPRGMGTTHPAPRHRDRFASEPLPASPALNEQDVSDKPAGIRSRPRLSAAQMAAIREAYQQQLESLLSIDEAVAAIVNALRRTGELEKTLIVFTADNGFFHGQHRIPSGKTLLYEPSIRVPLLMRGPGILRGKQLTQPVANIDIAPTIVDAAGVRPGRRLDGRSLLPLMRNPTLQWGRDIVIERGPASGKKKGRKGKNGQDGNQGQPGRRKKEGRRTGKEQRGGRAPQDQVFAALRTPRFLYAEYGNSESELYDLAVDPHELTSRHADPAYASIRAELARRLATMRACAGAACRRGPRLALTMSSVGRSASAGAACSSSVRASLRGVDARWVREVVFSVAGRAAGRDAKPPFARRLATGSLWQRRSASVVARATLADGRRVTLSRALRACR